MKALFIPGSLIVNTFDTQLTGQIIYGKIIEIDLSCRTTMRLLVDTEIKFTNIPVCLFLEMEDWNRFVEDDCNIFDLATESDYMKLFHEVSVVWEKYNQVISEYIKLHGKFPRIIRNEPCETCDPSDYYDY